MESKMETLCIPQVISNDDILAKTLQILEKSNSEEYAEVLELLADRWDYTTSMIPSLTMGVMLTRSMFPDYPESYFRKYLRLRGEDASMFHAGELIETLKDSQENYAMIPYQLDRLVELTTPLSYENLQELKDKFVSEQEKQDQQSVSYNVVMDYLRDKLNQDITAPVPQHVIDNKLEDVPSTYPVLREEDIIPMTMSAYIDFMKGTEDGERSIEDLKSMDIIERKETLTQMKYVQPEVLSNLLDDHTLYRIFGPVNPSSDYDFSVINDSNRYGGERMLLDNSYDKDDFSEDWFTGVCAYCKQNIKSRRFACRIPIPQGGWKGCYCSWAHVKKDILDAQEIKQQDAEEQDEDVMTEVQIALIDKLIREILKVGIFAVVHKDDIPAKAQEEGIKTKKKDKKSLKSKLGNLFEEISFGE